MLAAAVEPLARVAILSLSRRLWCRVDGSSPTPAQRQGDARFQTAKIAVLAPPSSTSSREQPCMRASVAASLCGRVASSIGTPLKIAGETLARARCQFWMQRTKYTTLQHLLLALTDDAKPLAVMKILQGQSGALKTPTSTMSWVHDETMVPFPARHYSQFSGRHTICADVPGALVRLDREPGAAPPG